MNLRIIDYFTLENGDLNDWFEYRGYDDYEADYSKK